MLKRILGTAAALLVFGFPALLFGLAAWQAVPRETCRWGTDEFCSEYGSLYAALSVPFAAALALSLWAIHRQRKS